MIVQDLLDSQCFEWLAGVNTQENIQGAYIGDMLSWVMGHIDKKQAWLTVQTHINILAIAVLVQLPCIIIVDNAPIEQPVIDKANEEQIILLKTKLSAFECIKRFF